MFLLGTDTRFTDGAGAAEFLRAGRLPLRADRRAQRAQLRAARRCDRTALRAQPARRRLQYQHRAAGGAHRVPLGGKAMTAANGIRSRRGRGADRRCAAAPAMWPRRSRCWRARRACTRKIRGRWRRSSSPSRPALAVAIFLLAMFLVDAAAIRGVGHLPRWIVWFFDQITDFGKSGWFLWPLGILFLVLAALPSLPRVPQLVLAAIMVRVGFLFAAIGVPGLFVNHRQAHDRAGAAAGRRQPRSLSVQPVQLACRLCQPAVRPCHHRVLGAGRLRHAVAARAHRIVDLCAADRGEPGGGDRALSERRAGRRRWSAWSARCWCAAGSRCGAWAFRSAPDGAVHQLPGPSLRRIKAVARALLAQ